MSGRPGSLGLLLTALAGIAIAFGGAVAAVGLFAVLAAVLRAITPADTFGWPAPVTFVLVGAGGFQTALLMGALWQGRRTGGGQWRIGVGFWPARRHRLIAGLCGLMVCWLAAFLLLLASVPWLREFIRSVTPDVLAGGLQGNVLAILYRLALIVVLAPVSEEFFFRGWLWEALWRRGYGATTTACVTALPWLLLHGADSPWRVLILVPAAVIFSIARLVGGSVRASLAVHMTNNAAAATIQTVAELFGHDV